MSSFNSSDDDSDAPTVNDENRAVAAPPSPSHHQQKKQKASGPRSKVWALAEIFFLVKAHHKATLTPKGTNQKAETFWEDVADHLKKLKEYCFLNYIDDKEYWEPRCELRTAQMCKTKFNKIQKELQRFIALLEADKKIQGKEMASGEDRAKWYARINKQYVLRSPSKNARPFKLFSFKEQLENEDIDIPKYCMDHHPKFNDIATSTVELEVEASDTDEEGIISSNSDSISTAGTQANTPTSVTS